MHLVKMKQHGDCGPACLAMALGCSLEEALAKLSAVMHGADPHTSGTMDNDLIAVLEANGFGAVACLDFDLDRPAILTVPSLNHRGLLHYVAYHPGCGMLDPSNEELTYPEDAPLIAGEPTVCWASSIRFWPKAPGA